MARKCASCRAGLSEHDSFNCSIHYNSVEAGEINVSAYPSFCSWSCMREYVNQYTPTAREAAHKAAKNSLAKSVTMNPGKVSEAL